MARLANSRPAGPPTRDFGTMIKKRDQNGYLLFFKIFPLFDVINVIGTVPLYSPNTFDISSTNIDLPFAPVPV